jgi:catechol 2,3-dioxygenase-like lactoylglutathione lyase family enzyme
LAAVIHHVGIEVAPEDVERAAELFELLGFARVQPPPTLTEFTWLEREGTQVHLMPDPNPIAPPRGHLAVVVPEFEATLAALRERGFEVETAREHWRAPRARVLAPAGHRIELMAAPPSGRV